MAARRFNNGINTVCCRGGCNCCYADCIKVVAEALAGIALVKGAVEGKLPVQLKDGKFMPLELTVTLKFDPNTQKIEVLNRG